MTNYYTHPNEVDGGVPKTAQTCSLYDRNITGDNLDKSLLNAHESIHAQLADYLKQNNLNHACFKSSEVKQSSCDKGVCTDIDVTFYVW